MDSQKVDNIKYIVGLSPEKQMIAVLLFAVTFLAGGWGMTSYNWNKYRDAKENQISNMEKERALEIIAIYHTNDERANTRANLIDSTSAEAKQSLILVKRYLDAKK